MILNRLVIWTGTHKTFHPSHFGFIPFRDCTAALCTLFDDVATARKNRQFSAAVCLDIQSAYDSVWIDNLIYKAATVGITGKMGRWIASFLTDRRIQIRWRSTISNQAPCLCGVPQGSVLSPLLFMIYMSDIFDVLEDGIYINVYADDIVVYGFGWEEERIRDKLSNTLHRIICWCRANKLNISPEKCMAINFSRHRDSGAPLKLLGHELPWSNSIKILGIWFSRKLTFNHHFMAIRSKAFNRLNYIKAVANTSRGVSSFHLLKIIDALIRSLFEYGSPLFFDSNPTLMNSLEVVYRAAIRVATGLPSWTPIPVLLREAGASSISSRLSYLTKTFLTRLLTHPPDSTLGDKLRHSLRSTSQHCSKWTDTLHDTFNFLQVNPDYFIPFSWPPLSHTRKFSIITEGLPFQDLSLPDGTIAGAWFHWRESVNYASLIASDASKDANKTAIAAVSYPDGNSIAALVPHYNSIFTAEALALCLAITHLAPPHGDIFLLSDSLSVLKALRSATIKSPKVILHLLHTICTKTTESTKFALIWCPGHKGISLNENADNLARNGPYISRTMPHISSEDICSFIKKNWIIENDYYWLNSNYAQSHSFLSPERNHCKWVSTRIADVAIARWRSKTILTFSRLYRMNISFSPLCRHCLDYDSPDHILLHCPFLAGPRNRLMSILKVHSNTYSDVIQAATASKVGTAALAWFSARVLPHRL